MDYIAIDVGSGLVKFANKENRSMFPSLVGKINKEDSFKHGLEDHQQIQIADKGTLWMTGSAAEGFVNEKDRTQSTKSSWSETDGHIILVYSAIALLYPNGFSGKMSIVTGLPMKKYKSEVKSFSKRLLGNHSFSTVSQKYEIEFTEKQTIVIPQVVGLHFSNMLKNAKAQNWQQIKVAYIDPGTQTTGWAVMDEGIFNNLLSDGENIGLIKLATEIKKYLKVKHNFIPTDNVVILKALTKGYINIWENNKQVKIDLVDVAQQFVPEVYESVIKQIMAMWNDAKDMHVVVSSGGGQYLIDTIQKHIPHAVLLNKVKPKKGTTETNEAIFDVVEGYSVYAENF